MRRRRGTTELPGVTIIELLVVVAILGVLVGMMLPALGGAREAGRESECASNLRQIATGAQVYADDHRGFMPPGAARFIDNLSRWHGSRANPSEAFVPTGGALSEYIGGDGSGAIRMCATFAPTARALAEQRLGFEVSCGGYGYNNTFVGVRRSARSGGLRMVSDESGSNLAAFGIAAKTICFSDSAFASDAGAGGVVEYSFVEPRFWPDVPGARADPSVHFRHRGRAGIAWLDTHVSHEGMTFTWSSGLYGVDPASVGIGFFGVADDNSLFGEH
jgi:prepilin-type N-terminal cleavage/methylation domain-containing protein/prepilin-type processing-associated H-X9-DG protein